LPNATNRIAICGCRWRNGGHIWRRKRLSVSRKALAQRLRLIRAVPAENRLTWCVAMLVNGPGHGRAAAFALKRTAMGGHVAVSPATNRLPM
jgi:hypothetical protein